MHTINLTNGVLVIRFPDAVLLREVMEAIDELSKLDKNAPPRLWDLSRSEGFSTADLERLADHAKSIPHPDSKMAVLVSKPVTFGLARMYGFYLEREAHQYRVFYSEQEAMDWLLDNGA